MREPEGSDKWAVNYSRAAYITIEGGTSRHAILLSSSSDGEQCDSREKGLEPLQIAHVRGVDDIAALRGRGHDDGIDDGRAGNRGERFTRDTCQDARRRLDSHPSQHQLSRVRATTPPLCDHNGRNRPWKAI